MNLINKRKHGRSRLLGISLFIGALFCAFVAMTEQAFSEISPGSLLLARSGGGNWPRLFGIF
jgi:hypothetical protein